MALLECGELCHALCVTCAVFPKPKGGLSGMVSNSFQLLKNL